MAENNVKGGYRKKVEKILHNIAERDRKEIFFKKVIINIYKNEIEDLTERIEDLRKEIKEIEGLN